MLSQLESDPKRLSPEKVAAVRAELDAVLKSAQFSGSKRCQDFLQFVVNCALEGDVGDLTERFIGVGVFGRPVDYETATDAIVRVRANDVRRRLTEHYLDKPPVSGVKITLTSGNYVPEFQFMEEKPAAENESLKGAGPAGIETEPWVVAEAANSKAWARWGWLRWVALAGALLVMVAAVLAAVWLKRPVSPKGAVEQFWEPVMRDQHSVVVCTGSVVFASNRFSGVTTAGRDVTYPFVSLQGAAAIAASSAMLERYGKSLQLVNAPTTQLTELREHSVILVGGYNNQWTMRLMQGLRFHFAPEPDAAILDGEHPEIHLTRDQSQPYSSTVDYSLLARFRDPTTDGWVLVLAGLGRNGSEAAAQFATSPHYMEMLRAKMGKDFEKPNIEVVLTVNVIDGKTGAPSILAAQGW